MTRQAKVQEPSVDECDPDASWLVRLRMNQLTKEHEVEIRAYSRDGSKKRIRFPAADRSNPQRIVVKLHEHNARLPNKKAEALQFVEEVIRTIPATPYLSTTTTGWCDDALGFVMPQKMYGSAKGTVLWDEARAPRDFGAMNGSVAAYKRGVLRPARQSTFLTGSILIALGAPLLGYVQGRLKKSLLPETAIFHWAGASSSGKTTLARVSQSVLGPPDHFCDYRTSLRGAAEEANARNDLVAIFDEAEHDDADAHAVLNKMKTICQCITAGRSRQISRAAHGALPSLVWTCFGISTGPLTQAALFHDLSKPKNGQAARFFDFSVPPAEEGGIFDEMLTRERGTPKKCPASLVKSVEEAMAVNHGVLLNGWIEYLLEHDLAQRVVELTDRFAAELSSQQGGVAGRVARKFAVLLAAAHLGIDAGLLPWSPRWVYFAIRRLYQNALENRDPRAAEVALAISKLQDALSDETRFPRVRVGQRGVPTFDLSKGNIGFIVSGKRSKIYLIPGRLSILGVSNTVLQRRIADQVRPPAVDYKIDPSTLFRVRHPDGQERKIRAWRISRAAIDDVKA